MIYTDCSTAEFAFPGPLRDQLVAAILDGTKTSTTGLVIDYETDGSPLPVVGTRDVVVGSANEPLAIIETTGVRILPLADINLDHAIREGEGYTSVAQWRHGHESFWHSPQMRDALGQPEFTVDDTTMAVAIRFRVVSVIPSPGDVNAAFAAESAAMITNLRHARSADLDLPTCCRPWSVRDEFAHTVIAVSRTLDMLDAPAPTATPVSAARYYVPDQRFNPGVDAVRVAEARRAATGSAGTLIDLFQRLRTDSIARVAAEPADRRVRTRHGDPMRLTDYQVTRVIEVAVHGLDLADALGVPPWLTPEAAGIVEGLLFGLGAAGTADALGTDRAGLIRIATGRTAITEDQRTTLERLGVVWLTLG